MELNSDSSVLFGAENYDDDSFYAEIRRQILLLTSEENEDLLERKSFNPIGVNGIRSKTSIYGFNSASLSPLSQFCSWETECSASPPVWLVNLWKKNGKGTGVFIPQVTCKKNQRPAGRMNNSRRKIYRPVVNKD